MIKPILFNTDEVRATLDGRKITKRLVVKFRENRNPKWTGYVADGAVLYGSNNIPAAKSPYRPGDILYVQETWREIKAWSGSFGFGCEVEYKAGGTQVFPGHNWKNPQQVTPWNPSIHMPREAARIWLRVTDVRVERLQEMTLDELAREGFADYTQASQYAVMTELPFKEFSETWDSTVKPADREKYGWEANPWVWVIEFERCEKPEEAERG